MLCMLCSSATAQSSATRGGQYEGDTQKSSSVIVGSATVPNSCGSAALLVDSLHLHIVTHDWRKRLVENVDAFMQAIRSHFVG